MSELKCVANTIIVIVADLVIVNVYLPNCKDVKLYNDTLCDILQHSYLH
jgi:hypothetical protein